MAGRVWTALQGEWLLGQDIERITKEWEVEK